MTLFGDYELQTTLYGLFGSSGMHPCLHCVTTKADMKLRTAAPFNERTLLSLEDDHARSLADGARLPRAKLFKNVIHPCLLPIAVDHACIPALHLDLGIFVWLYEALVKDSCQLDLLLSCSAASVQTDSADFRSLVNKQVLITTKEEELNAARDQAETLRNQLQWVAVLHHVVVAQNVCVRTLAGGMQKQSQDANDKVRGAEDDLATARNSLQGATPTTGPCAASLEPVLQRHNICRQVYHGGAFVGNTSTWHFRKR